MPDRRWRGRQSVERPTEDGDPDGGQDSRLKMESLLEGKMPDIERSTEDAWIDAGLDAQRYLKRSCPFFAERKEIKAGTNRRSRSDALIQRSHRHSLFSLAFFSSS